MIHRVVLLLLLSLNVLACSQAPTDGNFSTTKKVVIVGVANVALTATAVIVAPLILPVSAFAAASTATAAATAKATAKATAAGIAIKSAAVTAVPYVPYIHAGYSGAKQAKKYLYPSKEQQVEGLRMEKALEKPFDQQLRDALAKK